MDVSERPRNFPDDSHAQPHQAQPHQAQSRNALLDLGARVRTLRSARGLDPVELAARSGVDTAHLAGVEDGEVTPSLEVLARLAGGLEVALAELLTDTKPGPAAVVLRGEEVRTVQAGDLSTQILTPRSVAPGLYAARYRLAPSERDVEPVSHDGHDWLYVLSGQLRVGFRASGPHYTTILGAGDSVSFSARVPHRLSAVGPEPAEFLAVGATLVDDQDIGHRGPITPVFSPAVPGSQGRRFRWGHHRSDRH